MGALAIALTGTARGQEPAKSASPEADPIGDLTTRYHLVETYSIGTDRERHRDKRGSVGQYQVAVRDTTKTVADRPQGAPARTEITFQVIYSERAAEVAVTGAVTASVRRYEKFRVSPDPFKLSEAPPLEGLEVWFQHRPGEEPMILSLFQSRRLRELEVGFATRQTFVPDLSAVLPTVPTRVGDRWPVRKPAQRPLLGDRPSRAELFATLSEVRKGEKTPEAVIDVSGTATLPNGETALNARLVFTFAEKPTAGSTQRLIGGQVLLDAPGAITELRLAMSSIAPMPGGGGRLKVATTRELILARRLGDFDNPLKIPDPPPTPDEKNSWVTHDDLKGRFHFRHPQDLRMMPPKDPFTVELIRERRPEPDFVSINLQPKTGDPDADRRNRDPDFHYETLKEQWRLDKTEALPGKVGWLPETDWADVRMKVHRIEAALRPIGADRSVKRHHYEQYLALFGQDESVVVTAMTAQENPVVFRKQVEEILKTFRFESATPSR